MTAIAGLWRWNERPPAEECGRMLSALTLYGPDGRSHRQAGPIALGRTMMRLLPEDVFDRQPLLGKAGRLMLVADLRLDNRDDLTAALGIAPEQARQAADSEILLRALDRWNIDAVDRLAGDFAFALWDAAEQRLLLVRDPIGQRPLFYHRNPHFLAFASMAKGLHALPEVPYEADEERVVEELALMPDVGSRTFFKGIERVEPGHVVTVTRDRL
jgi:asparagine synthase (glutamine-hydrolysing)